MFVLGALTQKHLEEVIHISQSSYDSIILDSLYATKTGKDPKKAYQVRFIVDNGVDVVGSNALRGAIESGTNWGDKTKIIIENHGRILGRGGDGGRSAYTYMLTLANSSSTTAMPVTPAENGKDGGTAIIANKPIVVENYSLIVGGGGGGGGQGLFASSAYYNILGGGGSGGGAPYGLASPNENTYTMYLRDPTIKTRVTIPNDGKLYDSFTASSKVTSFNIFGQWADVDVDVDMALDDASCRDVTLELNTDKTALKTDFTTDRMYVVTLRADGGRIDYLVANMSSNATLDTKGLGGSNVTASTNSSAFIIKNKTKSNIYTNKGGDGGAFGENGSDGNLSEYFGIDSSQSSINSYPSGKGGLAGFIYQGDVILKNLNGGVTKGRML